MKKNYKIKVIIKITICLLMLFVISNCSTMNDRNTIQLLRKDLKSRNYSAAESLIKNKKFYPEKRNVLLKELEKGTIFYLNGKYYQALKSFKNAKKISDDLFTVSVSKKVASVFISSADNYYGERYERSLIRFYESLINYNLYKSGIYESYIDEYGNMQPEKLLSEAEKNRHLMSARAVTDEWDSLLSSYKNELSDETTYKMDLTQRLWAAHINRELGKNELSSNLYGDAKRILERYYNLYPSYNNKSKDFRENFKRLPDLSSQNLYNYIDNTKNATDLIKYIDNEINKIKNYKDNNLQIVLKDGFVSKKIRKYVVSSLPKMKKPKDNDDIEVVQYILPPELSIMLATMTQDSFFALVSLFTSIEFEVPMINEVNYANDYKVVLSGKNGIFEAPLTLSEPVSDIARMELENKSKSYLLKTATKTITGYVSAFIAAKNIYNNNKTLPGKIAAILSYKAATLAINEMLKVDMRYWSSLASGIMLGGAVVPDGEYVISVFKNNVKTSYTNKVAVHKNNITFVDINL
ncbi:MAG: hypothetical protein LBC92_03945 [Rickettsiales bacterium]|nr:hypothetical protein [Rickettsiales bacterium]